MIQVDAVIPSMAVYVGMVVKQGGETYDQDPKTDAGYLEPHIPLVLQFREKDLSKGYVEEDSCAQRLE